MGKVVCVIMGLCTLTWYVLTSHRLCMTSVSSATGGSGSNCLRFIRHLGIYLVQILHRATGSRLSIDHVVISLVASSMPLFTGHFRQCLMLSDKV